MNHFSNKDNNKKTANILVMLVFLFLSNVSVFAQDVADNSSNTNTTIENTIVEKEATNTSNMNFVIWFMGSKQTPNNTTIKAGENTRKQFMTSGMAPNRLLIKAFLKKAVNFEVATA